MFTETKSKTNSESTDDAQSQRGYDLDTSTLKNCMQTMRNMEQYKKGSNEFNSVKNSLETILAYKDLRVPKDRKAFFWAIVSLKSEYQKLIDNTSRYINRIFIGYSKQGKDRLNLVKFIKENAFAEHKILSEVSDGINSEELPEGFTWGDLLKGARVEVFEVAQDAERTGGNTSDIIYVNNGSEEGYFKKEERLGTAQEEIIEYIEKRLNIENSGKEILKNYIHRKFRWSNYSDLLEWFGDCYDKISKKSTSDEKKSFLLSINIRESWLSIEGMITGFEKVFYKLAQIDLLHSIATGTIGISKGAIISSRNVATSRLASLTDTDDVVAKSKLAIVKQGGVMKKYEEI